MNYECRIATLEEVNEQFNYNIEINEDKDQWIEWKNQFISMIKDNIMIPYYGFLGDTCISEAHAIISKHNDFVLIKHDRPYLHAFRTRTEYQGQHYFTKLFNFMIDDLKARGYTKFSVGVESTETKNKEIYTHYGFTKYLFSNTETYKDGSIHIIEYYEKTL